MRWEEMPKGQTSLAELVRQFESNCRLEGKPETTCRWYRHILARYLEWAGEPCLEDFTLEERARIPELCADTAALRGPPDDAFEQPDRLSLHLPPSGRRAARLRPLARDRGVHGRAPATAPQDPESAGNDRRHPYCRGDPEDPGFRSVTDPDRQPQPRDARPRPRHRDADVGDPDAGAAEPGHRPGHSHRLRQGGQGAHGALRIHGEQIPATLPPALPARACCPNSTTCSSRRTAGRRRRP